MTWKNPVFSVKLSELEKLVDERKPVRVAVYNRVVKRNLKELAEGKVRK